MISLLTELCLRWLPLLQICQPYGLETFRLEYPASANRTIQKNQRLMNTVLPIKIEGTTFGTFGLAGARERAGTAMTDSRPPGDVHINALGIARGQVGKVPKQLHGLHKLAGTGKLGNALLLNAWQQWRQKIGVAAAAMNPASYVLQHTKSFVFSFKLIIHQLARMPAAMQAIRQYQSNRNS